MLACAVLSDDELLARWRSGDAAAGRDLVDRHFAAVHRFFHNKANAVAEDLAQQTFLALVENADKFEGRASVRAYLFGIARNKLYRYYRSRRRRPDIDFHVTSLADLDAGPSSWLAEAQSKRNLQLAMRTLPVEQQVALELYYWEGMSIAEVADAMEVARGTIKSRLGRARAKLAEQLAALGDPALIHDFPNVDEA